MNKVGKYGLFVFDWEGTISDTLGSVLKCIREEGEARGFYDFEERQAREALPSGLLWGIKKGFPTLDIHAQEILIADVQESLKKHRHEVSLVPGVFEFIKTLHEAQVFLAVASNKGETGLIRALKDSGLDGFFHLIRGAGEFPPKPSPEMLLNILTVLNIPLDSALMIGDSVSDIEMASSVGMDAFGMTFCQGDSEILEKAGALAVFQNYASLSASLDII